MAKTTTDAVTEALLQSLSPKQLEAVQARLAAIETEVATPDVNDELVAAAETLYEAGVKRAKTAQGRTKRTLGDAQGIHPFRVIVTKG